MSIVTITSDFGYKDYFVAATKAALISELEGVKIAIVGVLESRNSVDHIGEEFQLNEIRKAFYKLFPGNWNVPIADLGNIKKGETTSDTHFAITEVIKSLLKMNIISLFKKSI